MSETDCFRMADPILRFPGYVHHGTCHLGGYDIVPDDCILYQNEKDADRRKGKDDQSYRRTCCGIMDQPALAVE